MDSSASRLPNRPLSTTSAPSPAPAATSPSASTFAALSAASHCSPDCQKAKRARFLSPLRDQLFTERTSNSDQVVESGCVVSVSSTVISKIDLKGSEPVEETHCGPSVEAFRIEEPSKMSTAVDSPKTNESDDSVSHLLDSKIIQSRYTEEELAAEPLLGVANWLNCAPSALNMAGGLTSPAPKYHSQRPGGSAESESRSSTGSPRGSGEVSDRVTSAADPTLYVWDLDETLIIFQSLRNGQYAKLFSGSKDFVEACEIGKRWEALILDICDDYFFYKQVEDYNEPCLLSLQNFDDTADLSHYNFEGDNLSVPVDDANKKKLAYRHRVVGELYSKGLEKLLNHDQLTEWKNLYEATDTFTDGWLTAGRELLEMLGRENKKKMENQQKPSRKYTGSLNTDCDPIFKGKICVSNYNILVTSGTLVPSLVKCMLFRLDKYFHPLNIYSSREFGKLQCFHWVKERVQSLPLRFCVIGDGIDECEAAQDLSWPFVKIDIGPYAVNRIPIVTMDIVDYHMNTIYDPSKNSKQ